MHDRLKLARLRLTTISSRLWDFVIVGLIGGIFFLTTALCFISGLLEN